MARAAKKTKTKRKSKSAKSQRRFQPLRWLRRWVMRAILGAVALLCLLLLVFRVINPPATPYMISESNRLNGHDYVWVDMDDIAPVMARSVVAAEDANFCDHWGFDLDALKQAIEGGGERGGSTISQQVVKNLFLWHGRSYPRKALEGLITPVMELFWPKRRILEMYLNVIEYDEGIFGIDAAAYHYFGTTPADLTATQASRLAAVLPSPKTRSAASPSAFIVKRGQSIADGAATIGRDGRDPVLCRDLICPPQLLGIGKDPRLQGRAIRVN